MKAGVIDVTPGTNTLVFDEPKVVEKTDKRTIDYEWTIGPVQAPENSDEEGGTELAVLSVYHYGDRKLFVASLHTETQLPSRNGFSIRRFSIMLGQAPEFRLVERVDRYSVKRLREFAARALAELREHAQDDGVLSVFGVKPVTTFTVSTLQNGESTLDWLQSMVHGDIEPIATTGRFEAYVNEDGKYVDGGLPRNVVGTQLWEDQLEEMGLDHLPGDYVAGPLVIVGPLSDDGDTTGASDELLDEIREYVGKRA